MTENLPSVTEVDALLAVPKGLVKSLSWISKDQNKTPPHYEFFSAVNLETMEIMEGVAVRAAWRRSPYEGVTPKYNFGLHLGLKNRVYALDIAPLDQHLNKVGNGREFYRKRISGSHEHFWTPEGYGYAEPLAENIVASNMESQWLYFCERVNIIQNIEFTSPDFNSESGQGSLL